MLLLRPDWKRAGDAAYAARHARHSRTVMVDQQAGAGADLSSCAAAPCRRSCWPTKTMRCWDQKTESTGQLRWCSRSLLPNRHFNMSPPTPPRLPTCEPADQGQAIQRNAKQMRVLSKTRPVVGGGDGGDPVDFLGKSAA